MFIFKGRRIEFRQEMTMTYATLMVHLDLYGSNEGLLQIAGNVAERFEASVIGIAACQPLQMIYGDGFMLSDLIEQDRLETEKEMQAVEERFRAALHNRAKDLQWRSTMTLFSIADYIAHQARAADLILIDPSGGGAKLDPSRRVDVSDLVMRAGRPVLLAGPGETTLNLQNALVAWKDTREAQRAVANALPLLKKAAHVTVVEVAAEEDLAHARDHVNDVSEWLKRHGISAEPFAAVTGEDDAGRLDMIAKERGAGLVVAGAYGHSRVREWVLGGVTRDLLMRAGRSALVSH
jgi:nucleotide-binding universal stress UspA family protein